MEFELDFNQIEVEEVKPERKIKPLSVAQFLNKVQSHFNERYWGVYLIAEISSIKHSGRHSYLTLKDTEEDAIINANVWNYQTSFREFAQSTGCRVEDFQVGATVEVYGELTVYNPRGSMQLNIRRMRIAGGIGEQLARIERIKQEIVKNGWHSPERKRAIPQFPLKVGIVSSSKAAGVQDMLKVFREEAPDIEITIYDANVQGNNAVASLIEALATANAENKCEVLIVGRGGGSFEDLLAFSDYELVKAILASKIPTISAVGHEVDNPLTDLVADYACVTPTAAAKHITIWRLRVRDYVNNALNQLNSLVNGLFDFKNHQLNQLDQRLSYLDPSRKIADYFNYFTELEYQLNRMYTFYWQDKLNRLEQANKDINQVLVISWKQKENQVNLLQEKVKRFNPSYLLERDQKIINDLALKLDYIYTNSLSVRNTKLNELTAKLETLYKNQIWQKEYDWQAKRNQVMRLQPLSKLEAYVKDIGYLENQIKYLANRQFATKVNELEYLLQRVEVSNPLLPLSRGYAMVLDQEQQVVTSISQVEKLNNFTLLMQDGSLEAQVKGKSDKEHNLQNLVSQEKILALKANLAKLKNNSEF
ncbi:exodeoxyribonuclease VII large subunit [Psittacicella hinzii]|uniref:Exodeoxyribonuclease 7 large subunit n=1 Tax=Psittacicella hinzii TaxID=2028575 RepID=A0A3A1Y604_9GAMM|nr:exodeoxyribonuclease VII large subunit [Psittacicella hinzii]RIY32931.1 exodeoxyribonuclease VII large subunit [Psittacicella hinzii]